RRAPARGGGSRNSVRNAMIGPLRPSPRSLATQLALVRREDRVAPPRRRMQPVPDAKSLHVLIVEDNEHDARAARRALEKSLDARVTHCVKAEDALATLESSAAWYDVALVDHGLPGMSGLELCKALLS